MSAAYVTTSWDDGHVLDLRLADLLAANGLPGTFYVAPRNVELPTRERLSDEATRGLAEAFEIGGHTLNHRRLGHLSPDAAWEEVVSGKAALEQSIGEPVTSFCYPGGVYGPEHPRHDREGGLHERANRAALGQASHLPLRDGHDDARLPPSR